MEASTTKRLGLALGITLAIFVAEVVGGIVSGSLALLSDAGHVVTDSFALALSLIATIISRRPSDRRATFGYHRVGLLAAVVNGVSLVGIAGFIFFEAYRRMLAPPGIDLGIMMPVAAAGLAANLAMVVILGGGHHRDLNLASAWLHVLGDTLASLGVIVSGVVIHYTGWLYADPVASVLIGGIIVTGGLRVVREALHVFLDLVPSGYNVEEMAGEILKVEGVLGIHDVHVRSLTHGQVEFMAHVLVDDQSLSDAERIRRAVEHRLQHMGVHHMVLQLEHQACTDDGLFCRIVPHEEHGHHGH
jgi:cobalt-zinc-cadmium efflux system protein